MSILVQLLLLMLFLAPQLRAGDDAFTDDVINPKETWQNIQDFDESIAFDVFGPPTKENAKKAEEETELYLDMLANYDDISDEEDDFAFVAEAYSVPTSEFRPAGLRTGENASDDLFDDDPLPTKVQTTSVYVDSVRQSYLPGPALKPRNLNDVVLGDNNAKPLFAAPETIKAKPKPKEEIKLAEKPKPKTGEGTPQPVDAAHAFMKAGRISSPLELAKENAAKQAAVVKQKSSAPMTPDEETLMALKNAVKELGLEKVLNFDGSSKGNQTLAQQAPPVAENKEPDTKALPIAGAKQDVSPPKKKKKRKIKKPEMSEGEHNSSPLPENKKEEDGGFLGLF